MDDEIISKKELLQMTGITYGQLYRWKRKNLIPEEWFIKKSSFTGQETFFLKDQILERVGKIMAMKDDRSLDALADTFSTATQKLQIQRDRLKKLGWIDSHVMDLYEDRFSETLQLNELLSLMICQDEMDKKSFSLEDGHRLVSFFQELEPLLPNKTLQLYFFKRGDEGFWILSESTNPLIAEKGVMVSLSLSLQPYIEKLNTYALSQ